MEQVNEFIWTLEDTAAFVGGRVVAAMRRYVERLLPPMGAAAIKATPLAANGVEPRPVYSVTNSTCDGLCYNARRVEALLTPSVDRKTRLHFDEAWSAYARFNPLYRDRHAMHADRVQSACVSGVSTQRGRPGRLWR